MQYFSWGCRTNWTLTTFGSEKDKRLQLYFTWQTQPMLNFQKLTKYYMWMSRIHTGNSLIVHVTLHYNIWCALIGQGWRITRALTSINGWREVQRLSTFLLDKKMQVSSNFMLDLYNCEEERKWCANLSERESSAIVVKKRNNSDTAIYEKLPYCHYGRAKPLRLGTVQRGLNQPGNLTEDR